MGTTGGNESSKQDAIQVYGQYNGTNLPEVANASNIDSESQNMSRNDVVPENCTYTKKDGTVISAKGNIPSTPATGDTYEEGDYIYTYNKGNDYGTKWSVAINTKVTDKNKSSYGEILSEVAGQQITNMYRTFYGCSSLTTAPTIPSGVTSMNYTFYNCTSLATAPTIPNSVTTMYCTFESCRSLTTAPTIPNSVRIMQGTFNGCTSLTVAPTIPNSVTNMGSTFQGCTKLTGTIEVNANPTYYDYCFHGTIKPITLTGSSTKLTALKGTATNVNITIG